jgi:hypothetical protein
MTGDNIWHFESGGFLESFRLYGSIVANRLAAKSAGDSGESQPCQQNLPSGVLRHKPSSAKAFAG